jgi:hypothetical protein
MPRDLFDPGPPENEEAAPGQGRPSNSSIITKAHISAPVILLQRGCRRSLYRRRPAMSAAVQRAIAMPWGFRP